MRWTVMACLTLAVAATGCGPAVPKTYPVSGKVTWKNDPLPDGRITFIDLDRPGDEQGGPIKADQFSLQATAGKKKG